MLKQTTLAASITAAMLLSGAMPCALAAPSTTPSTFTVSSPDRHIAVRLRQGAEAGAALTYSITRDGRPVLLESHLGLALKDADLSTGLVLAGAGKVHAVSEQYRMAVGKKRDISYRANEQLFAVHNAAGQSMDIAFRVSNDGVAFRYIVADAKLPHKQLVQEATTFALPPQAKAWLQPIAVAQTGWSNTNPSYEEHYEMEIPVGQASPSKAGWVFPALFRSGEGKDATWLAISEANMDGSFQASRLAPESPGGVYSIGNPMAPEVFTDGALMAESDGVLTSPWRLIALGSMPALMASTLGTDLAAPAIPFDPAKVRPGHASWSWAILKDDSIVYDVQKRFVDYAADMHWQYTLIDADWDRKIGYDKVRQLVDYAASKNVGILLWYNSSGAWNKTEYSPKSQLLTRERRVAEFKRIAEMGVKGVKIDFFAGDGKSMIAYYIDILKDAADAGLLVNFHGATLPRGWTRTYPNLMTMEAVRGFEYTSFTQPDEDALPTHAAMLPFARNLFDPMDFTPMVLGDLPNIRRTTRNGFELATSVLFISGIQHFAETPDGMASVPTYVKTFLQQLPVSWDDSRLVDGYPGRHVVEARRSGDTWYVAGINATDKALTLALDLSFAHGKRGTMIGEGAGEREFVQAPMAAGKQVSVTIAPHGGFVATFK